ncbi:MAG: hypothetical protein O7167_02825, partial [Wolbachia endosymbiont of Andrena nigroaenea]|nr:hypothetical protein [Wolbachia endosymbiont of Andrena nigroaenea]
MHKIISEVAMLSSIIKVKLEKNCCPFGELENFFAERVFHIDDRKGFKDSSVKLVIEHGYDETLTLPREAIPNSFALQLLSSLYRGNALALPIILKYLAHRNLSKDFDEISTKLQAKMDQDIQEAELQNNSKISKKIEVCKQDILNQLCFFLIFHLYNFATLPNHIDNKNPFVIETEFYI